MEHSCCFRFGDFEPLFLFILHALRSKYSKIWLRWTDGIQTKDLPCQKQPLYLQTMPQPFVEENSKFDHLQAKGKLLLSCLCQDVIFAKKFLLQNGCYFSLSLSSDHLEMTPQAALDFIFHIFLRKWSSYWRHYIETTKRKALKKKTNGPF